MSLLLPLRPRVFFCATLHPVLLALPPMYSSLTSLIKHTAFSVDGVVLHLQSLGHVKLAFWAGATLISVHSTAFVTNAHETTCEETTPARIFKRKG